ncbi:MAG: ammonium transporter [Prevotella sp.]|uniref:ammonium transporter n=1 Tax=Prevotella sp. TaxID=59823 RepID=UPI0025E9EB87|nr:ammonium transporter [Prevotella sp.]MCI7118362.1 ammonium transporter [Prevotella sp.]
MTNILLSAYTPVLNTGNTAWMIMATILVLLMSIPGIALFYGGLVRQKNVLSVIMQTMLIVGVVSLLWVAIGYTWAFGTGFKESGSWAWFFMGGLDKAFLKGVTVNSVTSTGIPELTFAMFQCMFALITPALILGAFAERIKFKSYMVFTILWVIIAYFPMAHWVWGGGFLQEMGALDFAGGTVVHINAGISALIMCLMIGQRDDYKKGHPILPHNVTIVFMGTSFLWLGWFGFNAGSGLAADGLAANAFLVTHVAAAAAAVTWITIDWLCNKKPTTVGACTGAVAGLVAITPAAGSTDLVGAFAIGIITPIVCFVMVAVIKPYFKYDDALDAFGVHGMGGIIGSILTGVFATTAVTGAGGAEGALYGDWHQLWVQIEATLISILYSAVVTYILYVLVDKLIGMRVCRRVEEEGLDIYEHGESAYN